MKHQVATISESRRRFLTAAGSSLFLAACAAPQTASLSRDGFLDVPGGKLYYETAGEGTPLIFLHGFAVDHRAWDAQFKALATSYRVVRFDLRGFGRSTVPSGPYSHSDDLLHLMRHLAIGQSYLAGASMGGRIAIDFALEHSQKVLALATINPVISGWEWSGEWLASYAPIVQAAKRGELSAAKAAFLAHPIFATIRAQPEAYAQLRRMVDEYSGWHFQHADPARNLVPPALTRLERLKVPTLLVSGAQDLPDFQRMTRHLEREAQARRVGLPGVGHMAHLEAPRPVSEALQAFFRAS